MNDEEKKERSAFVMRLVLLGLIIIFIVQLAIAIITLVKYKDVLVQSPFQYGMKVNDMESCTCISYDGKVYNAHNGSALRTTIDPFGDYDINKSGELNPEDFIINGSS